MIIKKNSIILIFLTLILSGCNVPNMQEDLKMRNDTKITVGEGEVCKSYSLDLACEEGLECILLDDDETFPTGYCYPPNITLDNEQLYQPLESDYQNNKNDIS